MKVFIVILNWNQAELTIKCLESIKKMKIEKLELKVVVVDNGSKEETLLQLREWERKKSGFELMEIGQNLGFAGGNNFGMRYALEKGADFVMILNNDTEVDKNLLVELLVPMKDEKVGISSPKIYFAKGYEFHKDKYKKNQLGKVIWYAGGKVDWKNVYGINIGVDEVDKKQYTKEKDLDFATGACFLVRAKALREVGLFNEKYFMYLEDADLCQRFKNNKWKIIFTPKAFLWHKVAQSSGIGSDLNDYFISRNRLLFGFKYATLRTKFALLRESLRLFIFGRYWQAVGIRDYFFRRFGKGSWL